MRYKVHNPSVWKRCFLCIMIVLVEAVGIAGIRVVLQWREHMRKEEGKQEKVIKEQILSDMQYFPIPAAYRLEVTYEDSFGASRVQGKHEGCDIMDTRNIEGRIPVVSATDGVVTNVGWLYLGGYRIGITAGSGIYYYYAHLSSYANGIEAGRKVQAGELLGFMGSTGEGEEGTCGNFPVHLHFGIYCPSKNGEEKAVNSYPYLLKIEKQ